MPNATINIKQISIDDILPIRHKVMWPNKPFEYVKLSNDQEGNHFGLFVDQQLISVISIFQNNNQVQFRKFATLQAYQGKGYGSRLLTFIIDLVEQEGHKKIWCNARVSKRNYYEKFGLEATDVYFEKSKMEYVVMEKSFASKG